MNAPLNFAFFERQVGGLEDCPEVLFQKQKQLIHERIISSLDIATAEGFSDVELIEELLPFVEEILAEEEIQMSDEAKTRLFLELPQEMFGIGPLEKLLNDTEISDILVNHCHEVFVERHGKLERSDVVFANNHHLMRIIQRLASHVGRRIDESSPLVDARMEDGSRVNAIIPPLALDGPKLSIRRFNENKFDLNDLVERDALTEEMASFLSAAVVARQSILIAGGTGSGKTTFLNALSSCIPDDQRVVTIEDSAELKLQHRHVARLETRPANSESSGEFTQRDLVRNSLRMRPDRIIVGEVRGSEALDMLQAMNTGHEGSLTTIHANDTMDAVSRLEMMVAMTGLELPSSVVQSYICSGISIVIHLARLQGGVRKVMRVSELQKTRDGYRLNDVFAFHSMGLCKNGNATGEFLTKNRPECLKDFQVHGVEFDSLIFDVE